MAQAVRFRSFGGPEVLEVTEIPVPEPGAGDVLVEVCAAGISPVESAVRGGASAARWPVEFPSGQGREFAGVVVRSGPGATRFRSGAEVMGYVARGAQATHVVVPEAQLMLKPPSLAWEVAGSLYVAGTTAWTAVEGLNLRAGDVVVITAAAGGVGCLAAQLARARGATVVGTTAEARFDFLRQFGVIPLAYGPGLAARVRAITTGPVAGFLDFLGGQADEASALDLPPSRVLTTTDWEAVEDREAVKLYPGDLVALGRVAQLVAERQVRLPIADVYSLAEVGDAYRVLDQRDSAGKIVIGMKMVEYKGQKVKPSRVKQQDVTLGVVTPHEPVSTRQILPPVIGDGRARQLRTGSIPTVGEVAPAASAAPVN
jgi:NADPH2:quinone reductase